MKAPLNYSLGKPDPVAMGGSPFSSTAVKRFARGSLISHIVAKRRRFR